MEEPLTQRSRRATVTVETEALRERTPEELAHHLRSRAGEIRKAQVQEALAHWNLLLGLLPSKPSLEQQMPLMIDQVTLPRVKATIEQTARMTSVRTSSRERFRLFVKLLRDVRRQQR